MVLAEIWNKVRIFTAPPSVLKKAEEALKADGWQYESQQMGSSGVFGQTRAHLWEKITAPDGRVCEFTAGLKRNGTDTTAHHDYHQAKRAHIKALLNGGPAAPAV